MQDYIDGAKAQISKLMERVPDLQVQLEWEVRTEDSDDKPSLVLTYSVDYQGQHRAGEAGLADLGPQLAEAIEQCLGPSAASHADIIQALKTT